MDKAFITAMKQQLADLKDFFELRFKSLEENTTLRLRNLQAKQDQIHLEVKKTNGHVATNDKRINSLEKVMWMGGGFSACLGILWTVFTFFVK